MELIRDEKRLEKNEKRFEGQSTQSLAVKADALPQLLLLRLVILSS